ncbi:sensor histidine kinase [Dechloromonas sp. A34]|uniref:sensor histidine kinase n=1 Tax=Dechloromonas sp. A34 TaxID=447588 RepID=UPI0022496CFE|nr:ATP-binding protein [Dechloromonas sp. A34]
MRPAIEALHHSLGSAIRLTNQLLSLSRAEPINGLMVARQPVDIVAVARDMVVELLPLAERKEIDLGFEGGAVPLVVAGHPVLLRELVANLVDNALRYTPEGGIVTVAVDLAPEAASMTRIRVVDNGPGIPAQFREQVFLRFFRLDGGDYTGSGLGLSIVREIVLGHDGEISLADAPGGGLLVEVRLPLVAGAA